MITIFYDILLFLILSFLIWYPWNILEYIYYSRNIGRDKYLFVFNCFLEDYKLYNPRNKQAKKEYIKSIFPINHPNKAITILGRKWMLKDLLTPANKYDDDKLLDCFKNIKGTGFYFYGKNIFILLVSALIVIWIKKSYNFKIALFLFYFHWLIQFISYY